MVPTLGKRKRPSPPTVTSRKPQATRVVSDDEHDSQALQRILQQHFESQFQPLEAQTVPAVTAADVNLEDENPESDLDWDGLDDDDREEDVPAVEIIEHRIINAPAALSKAEARAFMSSKPFTADRKVVANQQSSAGDAQDNKVEKLNLKNDLELQRLISESHLLKPSTQPTSTSHRSKILDLRLQALGSKTSMLKQEKMPMTHRKGMVAKAKDKESRRRREAKENGVILEKEIKAVKPEKKRNRGVTGAAVGKFKGGTLKLSQRDVANITRPRKPKRF